jgi:hypothetical protein
MYNGYKFVGFVSAHSLYTVCIHLSWLASNVLFIKYNLRNQKLLILQKEMSFFNKGRITSLSMSYILSL